jgi:hypothetical protein
MFYQPAFFKSRLGLAIDEIDCQAQSALKKSWLVKHELAS